MDSELIQALKRIEMEKGLALETVLDALRDALLSAYEKNYGLEVEARVDIDSETGQMKVVELRENESGEIEEVEVTPANFGRIAAQTAKQVIVQRIREAERDLMFDEYQDREGDIVTGIVQQSDHRYTLIDLGKVEALLPPSEQVRGERYEHGARLKTYIVDVRRTNKGPQIMVSRTHPGLLKRLFELEVPEIYDGLVEIKAVAREAGQRSKVAVESNDANVDPVGACVGAKGSRVRMIVSELRGEKVDIVEWKEDSAEFIANAISPAKVKEELIDPESQTDKERQCRAITASEKRCRNKALPGSDFCGIPAHQKLAKLLEQGSAQIEEYSPVEDVTEETEVAGEEPANDAGSQATEKSETDVGEPESPVTKAAKDEESGESRIVEVVTEEVPGKGPEVEESNAADGEATEEKGG